MNSKSRVAGIILAAGEAKRMGRSKVMLPFQDGIILDAAVTAAQQSALDPVVLVLGYQAAEVQRALKSVTGEGARIKTVINRHFKSGQSSSLKAGLSRVPENCHGAMFLLGDQPQITKDIIDNLVNRFSPERDRLVVPTCQGQRGNPVIVHRRLFPHLLKIQGDVGARPLFRQFAHRIHWVEVEDSRHFFDVDTPADYQQLMRFKDQL